MKNTKQTQAMIRVAAAMAICMTAFVACGPKITDGTDDSSTSTSTPFGSTVTTSGLGTTDTTTDSGGTVSQFSGTGATANFTISDQSTFETFLLRQWDNQTGFQVYVGTHTMPDGSFAGEVQIGYNENGSFRADAFDTGEGTVAVSAYGDRGKYDSAFNQWFSYQGATVAHGFFQDQYGALVLVINGSDASSGSDGTSTGGTSLSGQIWFKNFQVQQMQETGASQYLPYPIGGEQCWFVGIGPWSCRTFLKSNRTDTTIALEPSNGYALLGTFTGLDKTAAFQ